MACVWPNSFPFRPIILKILPSTGRNPKRIKTGEACFVYLKTFARSLLPPTSQQLHNNKKPCLVFILTLVVILIFIWFCKFCYHCTCIIPCRIFPLTLSLEGASKWGCHKSMFGSDDDIPLSNTYRRLPGLALEISSRNSSRHIFEHTHSAGINIPCASCYYISLDET